MQEHHLLSFTRMFGGLDTVAHFRDGASELPGRDPATIRNLESLGVCEGWHCLEVGAGGGTIADWLCARVGSSGHVVAIDIDTRFVEQLDHPNLEVRRQDIAEIGAVEADAFDLVHARMVLEHVTARDETLRNMVTALRPRAASWTPCASAPKRVELIRGAASTGCRRGFR
jgi:2-polyprenyl-3-methyl-5-hydroxy-6-metoxy-1,4-benzoquinol methylase